MVCVTAATCLYMVNVQRRTLAPNVAPRRRWLAVGGDVEIVPCRRAWVDATGYNPILLDSIPADLYYSDLDGTWDAAFFRTMGDPLIAQSMAAGMLAGAAFD